LIVRSIASVLANGESVSLTVFDNASSDESMSLVDSAFSGKADVELIRHEENIGFSRAINAAANSAREKYLLILNPDCELYPGALGYLKNALDEDENAGLAGPLVVDRQGAIQKGSMRNFPNPWNSFLTLTGLWRLERVFPALRGVDRHQDPVPQVNSVVEAVSGACMMVRSESFRLIEGMDENYGLHCEDLDLMYRLHLKGYHCLLVPSARAFHRQGVSSRSRPFWVHLQKHLGMQRFFFKFQSGRYPWPVRCLVVGGIWLRFTLTLPLVLIRN
jgi:GT2 family glycosyltransferase